MKTASNQQLSVGQAATILGVSPQTVRNWEKQGRLISRRSPGGWRFYDLADVQRLATDLPKLAWAWSASEQPPEIPSEYFCGDADRFHKRLNDMTRVLQAAGGRESYVLASLLFLVAGEIGDNSFAHNIGSWPDTKGIFFAYDVQKKIIVLADRGQGVRATLQRVRPSIASDVEAVRVAFLETISGRSPERRGNGLKSVKKVVEEHHFGLTFNAGIAQVTISPLGKMHVATSDKNVRGVIAVITF